MMRRLALSNPFGEIEAPDALTSAYGTDPGIAVGRFIQLGLRALIVIAGMYAVFNFVLAGYAFMSAGEDSKKVAGAWAKIWQTFLGMTVAAGAFVLAGVLGWLVFGDPTFLLTPTIPEP